MTTKLYALITLLLLVGILPATTPQGFNYQAVVRNAQGQIVQSQAVSMRFTLYDNGPSGNLLYRETDTVITNEFGVITVVIGGGAIKQGNFTNINWGANSKFMQVEIDVAGGVTYTDMGTTQLLSVPYALYAETSGSSLPGPTGATGPMGSLGVTGPTGLPGVTGEVGATGVQGPTGLQGDIGLQGPTGDMGLQGPKGDTGPQGDAGLGGPTGATGETGMQGFRGDTGAQGATGDTGAKGDTGATGDKGDTGAKGDQGEPGHPGTVGVTGTAGPTGETGAVGAVGPQGDPGLQGPTGPQDSIWKRNGNDVYNTNTGRVGIGTSTPQAALDVAGFARFGDTNAPSVKMAKFSGTAAGVGAGAPVTLGIADDKILDVSVFVNSGSGLLAPLLGGATDYSYTIQGGVFTLKTGLLALNVAGKPFNVLITYME